jgi:hypothetical protein
MGSQPVIQNKYVTSFNDGGGRHYLRKIGVLVRIVSADR